MNLWFIFLTGLTSGGLACLAMQGGLLASVIVNQKDTPQPVDHHLKLDNTAWLAVAMFLGTKLIAHTILGFALGSLGSVLSLSLEVRLIFQVVTAGFMFATAMNLLDIHPIFRYVAFQPPKIIKRLVKNSSRSSTIFAPALLGLLTIFVPCGVTQAMEVLAINSGSPIQGALIMFTFVLGTSPLFAGLGIATARASSTWSRRFSQIAATALILMAVYGLNGVLVVLNAPVTIQKIVQPISYFFSAERFQTAGAVMMNEEGVQQVVIQIENNGYTPRYVKVRKNVPVQLTLQSHEVYTCALSFVLKEFGINAFLKATDQQTFTFTPTKTGQFTYTCSMGMYTGVMEVI